MSTHDQSSEFPTEKQDELTDLLLALRGAQGGSAVNMLLRLAIANYVAEITGREDGPIFEREILKIAESITIPCHQHHTP